MSPTLNAPTPGKTVPQTFASMRSIRKRNSKIQKSAVVKQVKQIVAEMANGELKNADENREPVWSNQKSALFIRGCFDRLAPTDFVVRQVEEEDDNPSVDDIYDGGNRCNAIVKFVNDEFPIQIEDKTYYHYSHLPPQERKMFDNMECHVTILSGCTATFACEFAAKRNEGTTMSIGEKVNLIRGSDTPRAHLLNELYNEFQIFKMADDRGSGLKLLAQLIMSIERRTVNFTISDYHMNVLRAFFVESDTPFCSLPLDKIKSTLSSCTECCVVNEDTGLYDPPVEVFEILKKLKTPKQSRPVIWYSALVIAVLASLRYPELENAASKDALISYTEWMASNGLKKTGEINKVIALRFAQD